MTNLYEVLGVECEASNEEIRAAYRELSNKYHRDKSPKNTALHEPLDEICKKLNEAYEILKDEKKRKVYDDSLKSKTYENVDHEESNDNYVGDEKDGHCFSIVVDGTFVLFG